MPPLCVTVTIRGSLITCPARRGGSQGDGLETIRFVVTVHPSIGSHSSYSEGDHCPLSLSEGPKARTFFSVQGRRPALYFTVSLSEGPQARTFFSVIPQRPALYFTVSLSDSSKPAPYFTVPLNEMQLVRTVTQWAAPKPATSITV